MLGCRVGELPSTNLGLPLVVSFKACYLSKRQINFNHNYLV